MKMMGSFGHEEFADFLRCLFEDSGPGDILVSLHKSGQAQHPIRVTIEDTRETSSTWEALQNGALKRWDSRFCLI